MTVADISILVIGGQNSTENTKSLRSIRALFEKYGDIETIFSWPTGRFEYANEGRGFDYTLETSVFSRRLEGIRICRGQVVLVIDADCVPDDPAKVLSLVQPFIESEDACWGGVYLSRAQARPWVRAYNFVCRSWVEQSCLDPFKTDLPTRFLVERLLGGFFLVKKSIILKMSFRQPPQPWGGEDAHFFSQIHQAGHRLSLDRSLRCWHETDSSLYKFFRRAYLHGRARAFDPTYKEVTAKSISSLLKGIFKDLSITESFFALTHYFIVVLSFLVTKTTRHP